MENNRFTPYKRVSLDGKNWWGVWDEKNGRFSTFAHHGYYKTKKECRFYIDFYNQKYFN